MLTKPTTWQDLLDAVSDDRSIYYQAPLDHTPHYVHCTRRGKGKKVRVDPMNRECDPFWADYTHIGRFFVEEA